jgi:hypothetical protein
MDVAFTIRRHHQLRRHRPEDCGRGLGPFEPAQAFLVLERAALVGGVRAASRVQIRAPAIPSTASLSASTASAGWMKNPHEDPSPAGPRPLRRAPRPATLISVVSCAATIRRPRAASPVRATDQASSVETSSLADPSTRWAAMSPARVLLISRTTSEPVATIASSMASAPRSNRTSRFVALRCAIHPSARTISKSLDSHETQPA